MTRSQLENEDALIAVANGIEDGAINVCCQSGYMCMTCRMWWARVVKLDTRIGVSILARHHGTKTGVTS